MCFVFQWSISQYSQTRRGYLAFLESPLGSDVLFQLPEHVRVEEEEDEEPGEGGVADYMLMHVDPPHEGQLPLPSEVHTQGHTHGCQSTNIKLTRVSRFSARKKMPILFLYHTFF